MQPLDPRILTVWRIGAALRWGALLLVVLPLDLGRAVFGRDLRVPIGVASAVVLAGAAYGIGWRPARRFRAWRYALEPDALVLQHGVFTHVHTVVPRTRVQHLDVTQGLIEREHGLARLVVHTAGTRDATVTIPGLAHEDAEALRDTLRLAVAEAA